MWFESIYGIGRKYPLIPKSKAIDEKFGLVEFPYNSSEVLSGIAIFGIAFVILGLLLFPFSDALGYSILFYAVIIMFGSYVYATGVYYTQHLIEYREQMLLALKRRYL